MKAKTHAIFYCDSSLVFLHIVGILQLLRSELRVLEGARPNVIQFTAFLEDKRGKILRAIESVPSDTLDTLRDAHAFNRAFVKARVFDGRQPRAPLEDDFLQLPAPAECFFS